MAEIFVCCINIAFNVSHHNCSLLNLIAIIIKLHTELSTGWDHDRGCLTIARCAPYHGNDAVLVRCVMDQLIINFSEYESIGIFPIQ